MARAMLNASRMSGRRLLLFFSCLAAGVVSGGPAWAQVTSSSSSGGGSTAGGTENITVGVANPERYLYQNGICQNCTGTDVTNNPRPQNLNPNGINYTDCEQDLRMDFELVLSGFQGGDEATVQAWAGTVDCTQDTNRVSTAGTLHACWQVAGFYGPVLATTSQTIPMSVYARDVLRYSAPPTTLTNGQPYQSGYNYSSAGEQACHVQTSDAAIPLTIFFLPVGPSENYIGTGYEYQISADLVAPPPPTINSIGPGDTLLTVNWTSPGTDPDIVGFALYSDPPASGSTTGGCSCGQTPGNGANSYVGDGSVGVSDEASTSRCEEAGEPTDAECEGDICVAPVSDGSSEASGGAPTDGPSEDALTDGPPEGSMPSDSGGVEASTGATDSGAAGDGAPIGDAGAPDAGFPVNCNPVNTGGSSDGSASSCSDQILTGDEWVVGNTTTVTTADGAVEEVEASTTPVIDDEGGEIEGGVTLSGGGIASIPPKYKAGEIDSVSATSLTLTGLTNYQLYHIAVASIDGSGNVGPVNLGCATPQPTNDYWQTYKGDNGSAGGCALGGGQAPVFAAGIFAAAAALRRRRRRP